MNVYIADMYMRAHRNTTQRTMSRVDEVKLYYAFIGIGLENCEAKTGYTIDKQTFHTYCFRNNYQFVAVTRVLMYNLID